MNDQAHADLTRMRVALDQVDRRIAEGVRDRFDLVKQVGELKRTAGIPMMQQGRVDTVLSQVRQLEMNFDIPAGTLTTIFETLIAAACRLEDGIIEP